VRSRNSEPPALSNACARHPLYAPRVAESVDKRTDGSAFCRFPGTAMQEGVRNCSSHGCKCRDWSPSRPQTSCNFTPHPANSSCSPAQNLHRRRLVAQNPQLSRKYRQKELLSRSGMCTIRLLTD
jgi:hypothetical protein